MGKILLAAVTLGLVLVAVLVFNQHNSRNHHATEAELSALHRQARRAASIVGLREVESFQQQLENFRAAPSVALRNKVLNRVSSWMFCGSDDTLGFYTYVERLMQRADAWTASLLPPLQAMLPRPRTLVDSSYDLFC